MQCTRRQNVSVLCMYLLSGFRPLLLNLLTHVCWRQPPPFRNPALFAAICMSTFRRPQAYTNQLVPHRHLFSTFERASASVGLSPPPPELFPRHGISLPGRVFFWVLADKAWSPASLVVVFSLPLGGLVDIFVDLAWSSAVSRCGRMTRLASLPSRIVQRLLSSSLDPSPSAKSDTIRDPQHGESTWTTLVLETLLNLLHRNAAAGFPCL